MKTALMILLAIASVIMIISVLLQSSNSDGLSGSIAGGAEQLFGKEEQRLRGDSEQDHRCIRCFIYRTFVGNCSAVLMCQNYFLYLLE